MVITKLQRKKKVVLHFKESSSYSVGIFFVLFLNFIYFWFKFNSVLVAAMYLENYFSLFSSSVLKFPDK